MSHNDNSTANINLVPRLLTTEQAAAYLGTSQKALENWRGAGTGPHYVKLSAKCVRYTPDDLEAFILAKRRQNTAAREA